jgi:hypothetical protein
MLVDAMEIGASWNQHAPAIGARSVRHHMKMATPHLFDVGRELVQVAVEVIEPVGRLDRLVKGHDVVSIANDVDAGLKLVSVAGPDII